MLIKCLKRQNMMLQAGVCLLVKNMDKVVYAPCFNGLSTVIHMLKSAKIQGFLRKWQKIVDKYVHKSVVYRIMWITFCPRFPVFRLKNKKIIKMKVFLDLRNFFDIIVMVFFQ